MLKLFYLKFGSLLKFKKEKKKNILPFIKKKKLILITKRKMGCAIHETTQQKQDCCQSNNQKITNKPSNLKESHSALVKILESAPIRPTTNQIESPKHHHYRKRHSKITDDLDRSSEEDENEVILGTSKCPWKKNRIWRTNKLDDNNDNKMDTDEDNSMDDSCRRNSLDSLEGGCHNDSGCDSDCPENITELCKKFDENLTEEDVGLFLFFFLLFIVPNKND